MLAISHRPVLLGEAVEALAVRPDGVYLDATFGRGGHARAILARLGAKGRLLLNDRDPEAIALARAEFGGDPRVLIRQGDFATIADWPALADGLDGALFDLGVSSPQLEDPERGSAFSAMARLICAWTPLRANQRQISSPALRKRKSPECCASTARSPKRGRLRARSSQHASASRSGGPGSWRSSSSASSGRGWRPPPGDALFPGAQDSGQRRA